MKYIHEWTQQLQSVMQIYIHSTNCLKSKAFNIYFKNRNNIKIDVFGVSTY